MSMNVQEQTQALEEARLRALLEETLFPSPNSVELVRTPSKDYSFRFGAKRPHIAELFQENTKLNPYSTLSASIKTEDYEEARKWYFRTPYRMKESDLKPDKKEVVMWEHHDLPASLQHVFRPFSGKEEKHELLYSVDLFMLYGDKLFKQVPNADFLWVEKKLTPPEQQLLRTAVIGDSYQKAAAAAKIFLFFVGVPWRYMMFFGPRGYRKMMFDAGQLMGLVNEKAREAGWVPYCCQDFYDVRVDQALLMDGTERTALAITMLTEEAIQ